MASHTQPQGPQPRKSIHALRSLDSGTLIHTSPSKIDDESHEKSSIESSEEESCSKIDEDEENKENDKSSELIDKDIIRSSRRSVEPKQIIQKTSQLPEDSPTSRKIELFLVVSCVIVVVPAMIICFVNATAKKETTVRQSCEKFLQLNSKYPSIDNMLWVTLKIGVERAINKPGEPSTFVFLYHSSSIHQSLLKDVINITIACFGHRDAIWRTSNDFQSAEIVYNDEVALDRHREELQTQGVLVVQDLDQVPPTAAQIFFTICDSYEPLVRKAVIFFTIDISQRLNHSEKTPTFIAESILKDLWKKELHSDVLDPLVVRLTENVFKI